MRPYSQQILLALEKHGRLNCRQLAGQISHEFSKTKDLVGYMRQNGKLVTDGTIDDLVSYSLSAKGRAEAALLSGQDPAASTRTHLQPVASPAAAATGDANSEAPRSGADTKAKATRTKVVPNSLEDAMHDAAKRGPYSASQDESPLRTDLATLAPAPNAPINARFGLLNTGELVIMPDMRATIVLSAEVANGLRAILTGTPA